MLTTLSVGIHSVHKISWTLQPDDAKIGVTIAVHSANGIDVILILFRASAVTFRSNDVEGHAASNVSTNDGNEPLFEVDFIEAQDQILLAIEVHFHGAVLAEQHDVADLERKGQELISHQPPFSDGLNAPLRGFYLRDLGNVQAEFHFRIFIDATHNYLVAERFKVKHVSLLIGKIGKGTVSAAPIREMQRSY
jgi:hypothetical protein